MVLNHLETLTSAAKKEGNWQYLRVDVVVLPVLLSTAVYILGHRQKWLVSKACSIAEKRN